MTTTTIDPTYTLGRSDAEAQRLIRQARFYRRATRYLFEEAGLSPGMRVLDAGSGAGDVALLAAELVGPSGAVVGVDVNPRVLETARERAAAAGVDNVTFLEGDFRTVALPDDFDAVVGRAVLLYVADPVQALRVAAGHVRPGGIVAFQEVDFTIARAYVAAGHMTPLARQIWTWVCDAFERTGTNAAAGTDLHRTFVAAGLGAPAMSLFAPLGAGEAFDGYDFVADSVRSLLPVIERYGIAAAESVAVETLGPRLRAEVTAAGAPFLLAPFVGAWARTPAR